MRGSIPNQPIPLSCLAVIETSAEIVYTPQEIAESCGLSRRRVYDWLAWGWLRGYRQGGRWAITASDWEFFTCTCRGARGRLMPSLRDWEQIWNSRPHLQHLLSTQVLSTQV